MDKNSNPIVVLPLPQDMRMLKSESGEMYWDLSIFPIVNLGNTPLPENLKSLVKTNPELFKVEIYFHNKFTRIIIPAMKKDFLVRSELRSHLNFVEFFQKDIDRNLNLIYLDYQSRLPSVDFWEGF